MRRMPIRHLGSIALVAAIVACQSTPRVIPDSTGKAIVRAYGGGAGNWLAVTFKPIGEAHEVSMHSVNGEDATRYGSERQILLPPGHYEIEVRCTFNIDNRLIFSEGKVTADVMADRTYLVDAGLSTQGPQTCAARLIDTNGQH
jgi:hypothetical protein